MRYALYYTPPADHPLARFGDRWLGRRADTGAPVEAPFQLAGADMPDRAAIVRFPAKYGFHATLRAPFELADGAGEGDLAAAARAVARAFDPFDLSLNLGRMGRFLALVPAGDATDIGRLAAAAVAGLESVRRPLSQADRDRRLAAPLDPVERDYLDRFGYPYIFDRFRFHMTLTGPLAAETLDRIEPEIVTLAQDVLAAPVPVADLAVFVQPDRESQFTIHSRYPLGRKP